VQAADNLARRAAAYRLAAPPSGVDPDVIDRLWAYEDQLPALVERLSTRALQPGDPDLLFAYVAGAAVRHLTFAAEAQHRHAAQGLPIPAGDGLQYLRVEALRNELKRLPSWRWRVLHSPSDAPRFMITDRGWIYVHEPGWPTNALFLPMGPRVALLGYLDDPRLPKRRPPFEEHLDLCASWIVWLNAAAWDDPFIEILMAHPNDRERLERLPQPQHLRVNRYGPYRYRHTNGLFD